MNRRPVLLDDIRRGDIADHVSRDLDPRPVSGVDLDTREVWLLIGDDVEMGPFPLANYTYSRWEA